MGHIGPGRARPVYLCTSTGWAGLKFSRPWPVQSTSRQVMLLLRPTVFTAKCKVAVVP